MALIPSTAQLRNDKISVIQNFLKFYFVKIMQEK